MVKTKFKRAVSLVMAAVLSLGVFANIGTTAYAASGTKSDVYIMQLPRSGDTNNNGKWGHGELKFMNGWYSHAISTDSLRAMGSYSGNIAYCIEPGTGQHTGDTLTEKNEDYFNITKCKELALYDTGVTAEYGDKLITLSTCEYSRNNGRIVVVAKKMAE